MFALASGSDHVDVRIEREELLILNNALNEICNGAHLSEWDFATRMGSERADARALLEQLSRLLSS